jgi:hypothetical protein
MLAFYQQLFTTEIPRTSYLQTLLRVAGLRRSQIQVLASSLDWNGWG